MVNFDLPQTLGADKETALARLKSKVGLAD